MSLLYITNPAGEALDLGPSAQIQLDLASPLYFADNRSTAALPSLKTYPMQVPNTARNRRMLGRPADLDNPADFISQSGWAIYFQQERIADGRVEVEDGATEGDITFTFVGGLAGNLLSLRDSKLWQQLTDSIPMGETVADVLAYARSITLAPAAAHWLFPTIKVAPDSALTDADVPTQYEWLNLFRDDAYQRSYTLAGHPVVATLAPQPRVRWLLEQALATVGYTLGGVWDSHPLRDELHNLLLYSPYTLDALLIPALNGAQPTLANYTLRNTLDTHIMAPDVSAADLIRTLCARFCLAPVLSTRERRLALLPCEDALSGPARIDWTSRTDPNALRGRAIEEIPQAFRDDEVSDPYLDRFPLNITGRSITVYETLADAQADLGPSDTGRALYISSLGEYFEFYYFVCPDPIEFPECASIPSQLFGSLGKDAGAITPTATPVLSGVGSALAMATRAEFQGAPYSLLNQNLYHPSAYTPLVSPWNGGARPADIRFMLYRGLQADADAQLYPLASSTTYNYAEEEIGQMSLQWSGPYGLYATWWQRWSLALQRMRPVVMATRLSAADLAQLDWFAKVRIGQHVFLPKRIQVTLTASNILPARVEYMQLL